MHVLIVEDEPLVRIALADTLLTMGHEVSEAASGQRALEALNETPTIDLVLSDHIMPGMNGLALARAIRAAYPSLPVVMISASPLAKADLEGMRQLTKPFTDRELIAVRGVAFAPFPILHVQSRDWTPHTIALVVQWMRAAVF